MARIFINPGHMPGIDPGAVSRTYGVTEADIVAEIGELLKEKLEDRGAEVMLEQSDNLCGEDGYEWENSVCYHSNENDTDIFISLHCNALDGSGTAHGTEVFYGSSKGATLAQLVQDNLCDNLHLADRGIRNGLDKGLWVIKYTEAIAILVEPAFIDNDREARILINEKKLIADSICDAVFEYLEGYYV